MGLPTSQEKRMSFRIYDMNNMAELIVVENVGELDRWVNSGYCEKGRYIIIFDGIHGRDVGFLDVVVTEFPRRVTVNNYAFEETHGWMYINGISLNEHPMKITAEMALAVADNLKAGVRFTIKRYGNDMSSVVEVIEAGSSISYRMSWFPSVAELRS
jgi:hypothetical protein